MFPQHSSPYERAAYTDITTECVAIVKSHVMTSQPLFSGYDQVIIVIQPSGEPVSLEENVAMISEGTTGLVTWEAALYLAEWALENTHIFTGRYISLSLSLQTHTQTRKIIHQHGQCVSRKSSFLSFYICLASFLSITLLLTRSRFHAYLLFLILFIPLTFILISLDFHSFNPPSVQCISLHQIIQSFTLTFSFFCSFILSPH